MPEQLTALRPLDPADLVAALDEMRAHDIRLFANLTAAALQERLALTPPALPAVSIDVTGEHTIDRCIAAALAKISQAVAGLWPFLWGGEDFSELRDDALTRMHLPIRLADLARRLPSLRQGPACDLVARLLQGRSPRLRNVPPAIEWEQLTLAFAPNGLTIVVPISEAEATPPRLHALEWLAQHGNVRIAVLTDDCRDAFERVAYGARCVAALATRAATTNAEPLDDPCAAASIETPLVLALPPAPEGQPHPMSPIEQKLHRLIQRDDELRPLFVFNRTVRLPLLDARIDLVWLGGRVAVEIDGPEHRAAAKFRADRHRDYELVCAGYRVLRMTNEDVETDAALAIEKIRSVARLAREEAG